MGAPEKWRERPRKIRMFIISFPISLGFFDGNTTCRDKFMLAMVKSRITSYIITYKYHCWWFQPNPSEKWWSSSVGMMTFPTYGKIKKIQTTNQIYTYAYLYIYYIYIYIYVYPNVGDMPSTTSVFFKSKAKGIPLMVGYPHPILTYFDHGWLQSMAIPGSDWLEVPTIYNNRYWSLPYIRPI